MVKNDYIELFNNMIRGNPVNFTKTVLPIISEYLTEINCENSDKVINLIVQNPQLAQEFIPDLVKYYCNKYEILSIGIKPNLNSLNFNLKTILYYE